MSCHDLRMSTGSTIFDRGFRRALVMVVLLPYLILQAITLGIMPVATANGLEFVICTGDGVIEVVETFDEDTRHSEDSEGCPWAVAHGPAVLDVDPVVPVAVVFSSERNVKFQPAFRATTHAVGLPRSRAPPSVI